MTKIALKKIPTSSCTNKFSHSQNHNQTNFPRITSHNQQNFSHVQKLFIPTKFCHVHKTKFTYTNKLFPHISWTHSYKPNTNFSQCQYSQNPNQNSSKNITIYLHCQNSISLQHCPNCTMIKEKTTLEECSKVNIFKHDQSYNAPKNFKITNWQYLTMKLSMKHATTFFQAKKSEKNSPWCLHDNMEHGS